MRIESPHPLSPGRSLGLFALLAATLLTGFGIGRIDFDAAPLGAAPNSDLRPGPSPDENTYDLPHLELELADAEYAQLLAEREGAIEAGHIDAAFKNYHPAKLGDEGFAARVRLKGDLLDHLQGARWSLRVLLKDESFQGIKAFSIQAPATRGYLWEWLGHRAAQREGLLAPRSMFVSVRLQGVERGIYFLEEHFTKDLLESQQRREGPILKFNEESFWAQNGLRGQGAPQIFYPGPNIFVAQPDAFDEKHLIKSEPLARELSDGLARMNALMQAAIQARGQAQDAGQAAQASLDQALAQWVEDTVDLKQAAKLHALLSLFNSGHALAPHNLRFYFDPVAAKLEPIFFDAMAMKDSGPAGAVGISKKIADSNLIIGCYRASALYRESFSIELARMLAPGYLEDLLQELGPDLRGLQAQLLASDDLPIEFRLEQLRSQLIGSRARLRKTLYPSAPLEAVARHRVSTDGSGQLEVDVWPTSEAPMVVEAFIFENGLELPAIEVAQAPLASLRGGQLCFGTGKRTRFRFDANRRLTGLMRFEELLQGAADGAAGEQSHGLELRMRWRYASETETHALKLNSRLEQAAWWERGSRPRSPSLDEALAAHPFLRFNTHNQQLWVSTGSWQVQGDLVVPDGLELFAQAGAELAFEPGAVLLSHAALHFKGSPEHAIRLVAQEPAAGWGGVVVIDSPGASQWVHVWVEDANFIERAGWMTSGGASFYRSELNMLGGGFLNAQGEDALNLFGTRATLKNVKFKDIASDALDADFVELNVEGCHFQDIAADAIDTSGSQAVIRECRFQNIGDKAISAGERSRAEVHGGSIEGAAIGIAAKDQTELQASGVSLQGIRNFALAAYRKKSVFGPASIEASHLMMKGENGPALCQTASSISIDGQSIAVQDFDPKELYSNGTLGN